MEHRQAAVGLGDQRTIDGLGDVRAIERALQCAVVVPRLGGEHRALDTGRERRSERILESLVAAPEFVEDGGLMTYGVSLTDLFRRAATYVDKILKGRKPADLPVEQPQKFEFIMNLKAAKQIGLTIPPNVLARADRVIR